ncbi:glycosyltransferase family 4 protein [Leptospira yasudae]|uniref:Glycosyltransferase family 1 protein n=1 Tax=Leptospira yasudae TaxID=2202201 RepID=A0A6N4QMV1_9LEPT|nr:glycosyltransferase family 1 protein [Leptospira yasudae]TGL78158.1 glycosyltransferase family 1 protein [Leptospira yasudae]TGL80700.1 glycosyltransferase family 1 protein [Leptospira yasudae]TGL88941.1 glycosyltransferase family 1 protein [Leptospira yasudae]
MRPNSELQPLPQASILGKRIFRIAVVTETYYPEINGVAKTLHKMVHDLVERGHDILLFRPRQGLNDSNHNRKGYAEILMAGCRIPMYSDMRFGFPAKRILKRHFKKEKPDIVHVVTEGPLGWSAVRAAKDLGIPVVSDFRTNFHSYTEYYKVGFAGKLVGNYLRRLHNRTAITLTPSQDLADHLLKQGYENVRIVSRGIDTNLFHPSKRDSSLRKEWGATQDQLVVLYVGRIAAEKNIELAVQAFRKIQETIPNARMVLVGEGPLRETLEKKNPDLIFCGLKKGEELAKHYASGDLFLFPSMTETFGNVVLEAMASGIALVAYQYAAAGSYLKHGASALLPRFGKEQEFIDMTSFLSNNPGLRKKVAAKAKKKAIECTWEKVSETLESIYSEYSIPINYPSQQLKERIGRLRIAESST